MLDTRALSLPDKAPVYMNMNTSNKVTTIAHKIVIIVSRVRLKKDTTTLSLSLNFLYGIVGTTIEITHGCCFSQRLIVDSTD